jgi:hypothetical protein
MRTASGLMLVALGAILAFAVRGHPWWLNIQVVGWVIMLTGVAGMLLPRRGHGWLRRRMVLRRGPGGRPVADRVEEKRYPPYVMLNPGTAVAAGAGVPGADEPAVGEPPTLVDPPNGGLGAAPPDTEPRDLAEWEAAERAVAEWESTEEAAAPGEPRPAEAVVEEYVEE